MSDEVKLLPCPECGHEIKLTITRLSGGSGGSGGSYPDEPIEATRPPIGTDGVVERVAKALYQTTACEAERTAPDCAVPGFDEDDEDARQFCRALANSAIAAMKDAASD